MSKRLMVVGLDGAEWNLMKRWVNRGKLPTFKRLIEDGAWGLLKSTIPTSSAPAWTSAFTGVNPGKHNVFEFFASEGYNVRLANSTDRKVKAVWEILSEKQLNVIVVNVPMTYPPDEVRGIMISGVVGAIRAMVDYTHPREMRKKLEQIGYVIDTHVSSERKDVQPILDMIEKRRQLVVDLAKNNAWDLFLVVFSALDRVQHHFLKESGMDDSVEKNAFGDVILRTYESLDGVIEELLESVGGNTNFIFLSDHGFRPARRVIFFNNWFRDLGLLRQVELGKRDLFKSSLEGLLKRIARRLPKAVRPTRSRRRKEPHVIRMVGAQSEKIDWSKTKAWFGTPAKIRINLRGREPSGIVEPGKEYEDLRNSIIGKLFQLTDPINGEKVVERVHKREEIFLGPYTKKSPDLFVELKKGYFSLPWFGKRRTFDKSNVMGVHRLYGVFLAHGPDVQKGKEIRDAEIIDIAPTILHMLGSPIPRLMDGKVLKETFKEGSELCEQTILFEDFELYKKIVRTKEVYGDKEEEEIKARLEQLGYI